MATQVVVGSSMFSFVVRGQKQNHISMSMADGGV